MNKFNYFFLWVSKLLSFFLNNCFHNLIRCNKNVLILYIYRSNKLWNLAYYSNHKNLSARYLSNDLNFLLIKKRKQAETCAVSLKIKQQTSHEKNYELCVMRNHVISWFYARSSLKVIRNRLLWMLSVLGRQTTPKHTCRTYFFISTLTVNKLLAEFNLETAYLLIY